MLIPNVEDNYHSVGLKLFSSFYWITNLELPELEWIVKLDDDIVMNFKMLEMYLKRRSTKRNSIHCRYNDFAPTQRDVNSKWYGIICVL